MIEETIPAVGELSSEEQLLLSSELWNRNAAPVLESSANDSILEFLKKSREAFLKNPEATISHADLKQKYNRETE